jgi:hypothetical protein
MDAGESTIMRTEQNPALLPQQLPNAQDMASPPRNPKAKEDEQRKDELLRFKTDIDLGRYAQERLGFVPSKGKSYRYPMAPGSYCRFGEKGSQIVVKCPRKHGDYYLWVNPENTDESGTIIDLIQKEKPHLNLAAIRKELREELGLSNPRTGKNPPPPSRPTAPEPKRSYESIEAQYNAARVVQNDTYLATRGLRPETLGGPRFQHTFRVRPVSGQILFPHRNADGLCGFEAKSARSTLFSNGGTRALWCSGLRATDSALVVTESAIDCMSYHQLFPDPHARYMSTSGGLSGAQKELLGRAIAKLPPNGRLVIATDNDFHRVPEFLTKFNFDQLAHLRGRDGTDLQFFRRGIDGQPMVVRSPPIGDVFECKAVTPAELEAVLGAKNGASPLEFADLKSPPKTLDELLSGEGVKVPKGTPYPTNPGRSYAEKIAALAHDRRPTLAVEIPVLPLGYKDWNDVVKAREHEFIREAERVHARERDRSR